MRAAQDWFEAMVRRTGFLERYPHFAPNLAGIEAVEDSSCLMAVSAGRGDRVRLHVNTAFFDAEPAAFRPVLQHELHHVLAGHLAPCYRGIDDAAIMQVAKEITANEHIAEPLPGDPHRCADYAQYGIRPGQDTWERYRLLVAARNSGRWSPPEPLHLCCRHGAGDGATGGQTLPVAATAGRGADGGGGELPVDLAWPAMRDWRGQLHRFASSRLTRRHSRRRPHRSDPDCRRVGELLGWTRLPSRSRLLVALDTSASMAAEMFPRIAGELQAIARVADVVIVECDKVVRREYEFDGRLDAVNGRGGTDLRPVFDPVLLRRHRADGVVYFTDGEGPWPDAAPAVRTLWVLVGERPFECPWGAQVRLDPEPADGRLQRLVRLGPGDRRA